MSEFNLHIKQYEDHHMGINTSPKTITLKLYFLKLYTRYLAEQGMTSFLDVEEKDLVAFASHLQNTISLRTKKKLSLTTINKACSCVRDFYRFLLKNDIILTNPFEDFSLDMKVETKIRDIFTIEEMVRFLDSIDVSNHDGIMNRTIFEFMYSSGLRSMEVSNLQIRDIDLSERIALIKQGKGKKDRYVPFSDMVYHYLCQYIAKVRPPLERKVPDKFKGFLFLTRQGNIGRSALRRRFLAILEQLHIVGKNLTLHSIRHSCATHLLEAGADVRYVQELLGHEEIETTVKYTHLMIDNLKRIYKTFHPRENAIFDEIDDAYLSDIEDLVEEIKKQQIINDRGYARRKN